jgi:hypothetical protein
MIDLAGSKVSRVHLIEIYFFPKQRHAILISSRRNDVFNTTKSLIFICTIDVSGNGYAYA